MDISRRLRKEISIGTRKDDDTVGVMRSPRGNFPPADFPFRSQN